jgi:peptidyl-prolyl cis-trans isomerase SurA
MLRGFLFSVAFALLSHAVFAGASARIEAVVNGVPITTYELSERVRLSKALLSASKVRMDDADVRTNVLGKMIDDRIRVSEAAKYGISATPDEVRQGMGRMEQYLGLPAGGYGKILKDSGISEDVLRSQVTAEVVWMKFVYQVLRGRVRVSDRDVELFVENAGKAGANEYTIVPLITDAANAGRLSDLVASVDTCDGFADIAGKNGMEGSGAKIRVADSEMHPDLLRLVESRPVLSPLPPLGGNGVETIFFVCAKEPRPLEITEQDREKIKYAILSDKLDAAAARYFERLKSAVVIEVME